MCSAASTHYEMLHLYTSPQSLYEEMVSLLNAPVQIGRTSPLPPLTPFMVIPIQTADNTSLTHLRERVLAETAPGSRLILDLKEIAKLSGLQAAILLQFVIEGKKKDIE